MADKVDPIQELLINARRTQILDAATTIFAKKGFHKATIKDIAQEAGIADGTIYTYFDSKPALMLGILDRLNQSSEREQHFAEGSAYDLRSFFVAYTRQRMELIWANIEVFRAVLPELLVNTELREQYYQQIIAPSFAIGERYFEMAMEQGLIRKMDVPLTIRNISASVLGLLIIQLLGDKVIEERWRELPEIAATMILEGLQLSNPVPISEAHQE